MSRQNYLNTTYATFARSIGSDPDGVFRDTVAYPGTWAYIPAYKYINTGTCLDKVQCDKLGLNSVGFEHFYSWRVHSGSSPAEDNVVSLLIIAANGITIMPYEGKRIGYTSWRSGETTQCDTGRTVASGIRPVFKLKPGLELRMENGVYELD